MTHGALVASIRLAKSVFAFMMANSAEHSPRETGGILLGFVRDTVMHIVEATPSGPLAEHRPTSFTRDGVFSQRLLETSLNASGGAYD